MGTGPSPDLTGFGSSRILVFHILSWRLGLISLVSTMLYVGGGVAVVTRWPSYLLKYNVFENSHFAVLLNKRIILSTHKQMAKLCREAAQQKCSYRGA